MGIQEIFRNIDRITPDLVQVGFQSSTLGHVAGKFKCIVVFPKSFLAVQLRIMPVIRSKRIMSAFRTNGGHRAMSSHEFHVIAQQPQPLPDGIQQRCMSPLWESRYGR